MKTINSAEFYPVGLLGPGFESDGLDLNTLVKEITGEKYEGLRGLYDHEVINGCYQVYDLVDDDDVEEYLENYGDEDAPNPHPAERLAFLIKEGHLPKGRYLLHVWW